MTIREKVIEFLNKCYEVGAKYPDIKSEMENIANKPTILVTVEDGVASIQTFSIPSNIQVVLADFDVDGGEIAIDDVVYGRM